MSDKGSQLLGVIAEEFKVPCYPRLFIDPGYRSPEMEDKDIAFVNCERISTIITWPGLGEYGPGVPLRRVGTI